MIECTHKTLFNRTNFQGALLGEIDQKQENPETQVHQCSLKISCTSFPICLNEWKRKETKKELELATEFQTMVILESMVTVGGFQRFHSPTWAMDPCWYWNRRRRFLSHRTPPSPRVPPHWAHPRGVDRHRQKRLRSESRPKRRLTL